MLYSNVSYIQGNSGICQKHNEPIYKMALQFDQHNRTM